MDFSHDKYDKGKCEESKGSNGLMPKVEETVPKTKRPTKNTPRIKITVSLTSRSQVAVRA